MCVKYVFEKLNLSFYSGIPMHSFGGLSINGNIFDQLCWVDRLPFFLFIFFLIIT